MSNFPFSLRALSNSALRFWKKLSALLCATGLASGFFPGATTAVAVTGRSSYSGTYTVIDPPGSVDTEPAAINPNGEVAGWYTDAAGEKHGFLLAGNTYTVIDPPGSRSTVALGINRAGQVVGSFANVSGITSGFMYDGSAYSALSAPNSSLTVASGIADTGQIIGFFERVGDFARSSHGFVYTQGAYSLVAPPNTSGSVPSAISENGQYITGTASNSSGTNVGFLLVNGVYTPINVPNSTGTIPQGVNDSGEVAGHYRDSSRTNHGFLFSNGGFQTFDPPGSVNSHVARINDSGQAFGFFTDSSRAQHGFLLSGGSTLTILDPPNSTWVAVTGGNDNGQAVGSFGAADHPHGFVFTPTANITIIHTFQGSGWRLISSPYTLGQSLASLSIRAYAFDPATQSYVYTPTPPADTFHIGRGYWVYIKANPGSLDIPGPGTPADQTQPVTITLSPGWNLVGEPFASPEPLSSIQVVTSTGASDFPSSVGHGVSSLYVYNGDTQTYEMLNSASDSFVPWSGAWVYAKQAGIHLLFNPPSSLR